MADLANPTVNVSYLCGCSFTDTTETGGGKTWRFGGDETRVFQLALAAEKEPAGAKKRAALQQALDAITDTAKPTRASLETARDRDTVTRALTERQASDVPDITVDVTDGDGKPTGTTVRFPQPPPACPRHNQPAVHTHASYLNPADREADEKVPT